MPNHIQNKLQFLGETIEIEKLMNHIKNEEVPIDFNKIVEMPKELDIESNGWLSPLENKYSKNDSFFVKMEEFRAYLQKNEQRREHEEANFIQGIKNFLAFGHATWYSWTVKNWGTKWNAYEQPDARNTNDTIYFQTAWNSPVELIKKLSSLFPNVKLILTFASEDSGCCTGIFEFQNGITLNEITPENMSNEGYDLYFSLHPGRKEDYQLVEGKYEYIDSEE